jgi:hypothetical protein
MAFEITVSNSQIASSTEAGRELLREEDEMIDANLS